MKTKIFLIAVFFILMGAIPVIVLNAGGASPAPGKSTEGETPAQKATPSDEEVLRGMLFAQYEDALSGEAMKAEAVIFKTSYKADPGAFDLCNDKIYLDEKKAKARYDNSYEEINDKITSTVNSVKEIYIYQKGKIVYIPFSKCSSGYTQADEKYPYLTSVASPWDCLSEAFSKNNSCTGVSLEGIKYLTNNGCDYATALKWYLPELEIK